MEDVVLSVIERAISDAPGGAKDGSPTGVRRLALRIRKAMRSNGMLPGEDVADVDFVLDEIASGLHKLSKTTVNELKHSQKGQDARMLAARGILEQLALSGITPMRTRAHPYHPDFNPQRIMPVPNVSEDEA